MNEKPKEQPEERKLRDRDLVALMAAVVMSQEKSPADAVEKAIQIRNEANKRFGIS